MRWEDERYVRLYTRDSADWLMMSFEAQGLLALLLRKADRAGIIDLGRHGKRSVAILIGHPHRWDSIEPALEELLDDGVVELRGDLLVFKNYIEAQTVAQSDRLRKEESRSRARDIARASGQPVTKSHERSQPVTTEAESGQTVTNRDAESQIVTKSHERSQAVTDGHSVLCCAVPSSAVVVGDAEPPPPLTLEPTKPQKPPRKLSAQQRFWAWAQKVRAEEGMLPDSRWTEPRINKLLAWVADHPPEAVTAAYGLFLDDERMQAQSPPCPMAFFASDWPKWMDMAEREGLLDAVDTREAVAP